MHILDRWKIKAKLALIVGISALALVAALIAAADMQRQRMMADRTDKIRAVVETAYGLADALEQEVTAGHIGRDEAMARFRLNLHSMWYDRHQDYILMATLDGIVHVHPKTEVEGTRGTKLPDGSYIIDTLIAAVPSADEGTVSYLYPKPGQTEPLPKFTFIKKFKPWNAILATGVYIDDIDVEYRAVLAKLALTGLVIMAVAAGLAYLISRNIGNSLAALKGRMERLASGDLTVDIREASRTDEIGEMARTVQVFKDGAIARQRLETESSELKRKAEQEKKQMLRQIADGFETQVRSIVAVVSGAATQMQSTARSTLSSAGQVREQTLAVASGAGQASTSVETVAAASEELSVSITDIGRQVGESARVAKQAADEGERTNAAIAGLSDAAQKIGEVVALINDVASQTNLLALNATIEAARAGDAGKGFAVVASEVKALASQTARATDDIRSQIGAIQGETKAAVDAIRSISKTILRVNEISAAVAAAVDEQAAATHEITRNVHQAASSTQDVSRNIAGVSAAVEHAGKTAGEVLAAADELAGQAQSLSREVEKFLTTVRAA